MNCDTYAGTAAASGEDQQQHQPLTAAAVSPKAVLSSLPAAPSPRSRRMWCELTTCDWSSKLEEELRSTVALLPIGAIEQHGPHLPTGVDTYQCVGIVQSALDSLDAGEHDRNGDAVAPHIFALPTQDIGTSHEHLEYVRKPHRCHRTSIIMLLELCCKKLSRLRAASTSMIHTQLAAPYPFSLRRTVSHVLP